MKKRKKTTPSLFDRFCDKFGPSILKVCRTIDKCTHPFFEGLACILTGGAYQPQPYKEPEESNKNNDAPLNQTRHFALKSLSDDAKAVMGDFCSVGRDMSKAVKRLERENPEFAKAVQEAQNSPEFQQQTQIVRQKIAEVQRRCEHIHRVCSYPTTIASGNTSQNDRTK